MPPVTKAKATVSSQSRAAPAGNSQMKMPIAAPTDNAANNGHSPWPMPNRAPSFKVV